MAKATPNIEDHDLVDILRSKLASHELSLAEHEEQAAYHQKEALFHRSRVEYIKSILKDAPLADNEKDPYNADEGVYRAAWWKRKIRELTIKEEFTRNKLFQYIGLVWDKLDNEDKQKMGYAASIALSESVKAGVLSARLEEGTKGKIYKLKKTS